MFEKMCFDNESIGKTFLKHVFCYLGKFLWRGHCDGKNMRLYFKGKLYFNVFAFACRPFHILSQKYSVPLRNFAFARKSIEIKKNAIPTNIISITKDLQANAKFSQMNATLLCQNANSVNAVS